MKNNHGFILVEALASYSLMILITISASIIIMFISQNLSHYAKLNQEKIIADNALTTIKKNLIFATDIKLSSDESTPYSKYFKIEDGALKTDKGFYYNKNHFKNNPMEIEIDTKNYGLMNLNVKILDKNHKLVYSTSRTFKILYLNKLKKAFAGHTGNITNPIIYYEK